MISIAVDDALALTGWIHSYAFERRLANGNVRFDLPELWMFKKPPPQWMLGAKAPTPGEFEAVVARYPPGQD